MFVSALLNTSENLAIGGKLTLMGVLIVFALLGLIVVILTIMENAMRKSAQKPPKQRKSLKEFVQSKKKEKADASDVVVPEEVKADAESAGISPEIIAAITASIACVTSDEGENSNQKFIVRNIKKLSYRR